VQRRSAGLPGCADARPHMDRTRTGTRTKSRAPDGARHGQERRLRRGIGRPTNQQRGRVLAELRGTPFGRPRDDSQFEVLGGFLPGDGAQGRIGGVAGRDVGGGLEPRDREGRAVQDGVDGGSTALDRKRPTQVTAGSSSTGPKPPAGRSGWSRWGVTRCVGVLGNAAAVRRARPSTMRSFQRLKG
jgi:hypothetical protein